MEQRPGPLVRAAAPGGAERPDVFWASSTEQLEELVLQLLAEPERLRAIPVAPTPQDREPQGEQAYYE